MESLNVLITAASRRVPLLRAFQQALAYNPDRAPVMLNMAKLYEKKGQGKDALRIADELLARPAELSRESYEELRELVKRLRATT